MIPGFEDTLKNAIPPAAPASAGGQPLSIAFPGVGRPSGDIAAVRDGRRSVPLGYLVDLSVAHTIAAGTQITVPLQGNTFMADPLYDLTGLAQAGIARVHFEGENVTPYDTYVTALPGAIYRVPFTKVTIENYAQAGKFLYIVYGIDLDLVPGQLQLNDITDRASRLLGVVLGDLSVLRQQQMNGGAGMSGAAFQALATRDFGYAYGAGALSNSLLGALGTVGVFTAAANVNGAMVWSAELSASSAAANTWALLAKTGAVVPGSIGDGDPLLTAACLAGGLATARLERAVFVPAGKALWFISTAAEATITVKDAKYTLL